MSKPATALGMAMIGQLRRQLRVQGISQAEWCRMMGLTEDYVSRVFNGRCGVSLERLMTWATVLDCCWYVDLRGRQEGKPRRKRSGKK